MNPRTACVVILTKMAIENGDLHGKEGKLIDRMCTRLKLDRDKIEETARESHLAQVLKNVVSESDRLVVAFHAYLMAHIDGSFDDWEDELYTLVLTLLEITPDDQTAIEGWAKHVLRGAGMPAAFSQVVAASSFKGM